MCEASADLHRTRCHGHVVTDDGGPTCYSSPPGYSPADLRSAYRIPSSGGDGQWVAVVVAYDYAFADNDLAVYRNQFGLPPCTWSNGCLRKVNQYGALGPLPPPEPPNEQVVNDWVGETMLDLDMVSAACPDCRILLVEANDDTVNDLLTAVDSATALGASVVSGSWGRQEWTSDPQLEATYLGNHFGTQLFFSSGDQPGVQFPANSQYVTAVGGTTLGRAGNLRGWSESVWHELVNVNGQEVEYAPGAGCSNFIAKPSWQHDPLCSRRTVADIAAVADPRTGVSMWDGQTGCWYMAGGTSAAAPLVAGIHAITHNASGDASLSYRRPAAFFDVTTGYDSSCPQNNYLCEAGPGYDGPTGNGTPNGSVQGVPLQTETLAGWGPMVVCGRGGLGMNCAISSADDITSGSFGPVGYWQSAFGDGAGWGTSASYYSTIQLVDVNGDGQADVCGRGGAGINCALSDGTGFGPATVWQSSFSDGNGWNASPAYYATIQFADINGDGKADVCGRGTNGIWCALSTGTSFGPQTLWQSSFSDANGWKGSAAYYSTIQLADVNGDGKADVCGRGTNGIWCALSNGTSFGAQTLWSTTYSDGNGWNLGPQYYGTIRFPDLDGDGKADVCGRTVGGLVCALSTGTSFGATSAWSNDYSDYFTWNSTPAYWSTIQFPDLDGDGKADVCGRGGWGMLCALSNGTSFGATSWWQTAFGDNQGWNGGPQYYGTFHFPDLNGDGKADVCGRGGAGINCALSNGTSFGPVAIWSSDFSDGEGWNNSASYYTTIRFATQAHGGPPVYSCNEPSPNFGQWPAEGALVAHPYDCYNADAGNTGISQTMGAALVAQGGTTPVYRCTQQCTGTCLFEDALTTHPELCAGGAAADTGLRVGPGAQGQPVPMPGSIPVYRCNEICYGGCHLKDQLVVNPNGCANGDASDTGLRVR
jgi:hypothetical protein